MRSGLIKILVFVLFIAGAWYYFFGTGEMPDPDPISRLERDGPDVEQNITAFSVEGRSPRGARQWNLSGASARLIEDRIFIDDLTAVVYAEGATINLSSRSGIYDRSTEEVELIGDVHVYSGEYPGKEFSLRTEKALWSQADREIFSENSIEITREGLIATGKGGRANAEARWARLKSDVMVFIDTDNTRVRSEGPLEIRYEDRLAIFKDNVVVEDERGRLSSDTLTVEFDGDTGKIEKVTAEGNVMTKRGDSYTISEKAVYVDGTKSAVLYGRPRVVIDPSEIENFESFKL